MFDKVFTEDEIAILKTLNGSSGETTYEIFKALDAKTRACELTRVAYVDGDTEHSYQYDVDGMKSGVQ